MKIEIASLPSKEYGEVIEIRVPTRFYFNKDGTFDGIEFGKFETKLQPWEEQMVDRCLSAVIPAMDEVVDENEDDDSEDLEPA